MFHARQIARRAPALVMLSVTGLCFPAAAAGGEAEVLTEVLTARSELADHLLVALSELTYSAVRTLEEFDERSMRSRRVESLDDPITGATGFRLEIVSARSVLAVQQGEHRNLQTWSVVSSGPDRWSHDLTFLDQSAGERRETSLRLTGLDPRARLTISDAVDDDRWYLFNLGLSRREGTPLATLLGGPLTVSRGETLRGQACNVLRGPEGELWLAPAFGHAPLRLLTVGERGQWCNDWWGYRQIGELWLPQFRCSRSVTPAGWLVGLTIDHLPMAVAGEAQVAELAPPELGVPVIAGSSVHTAATRGADAPAGLGTPPIEIWRIAEDDGRRWGFSLRELLADNSLRLPLGP